MFNEPCYKFLFVYLNNKRTSKYKLVYFSDQLGVFLYARNLFFLHPDSPTVLQLSLIDFVSKESAWAKLIHLGKLKYTLFVNWTGRTGWLSAVGCFVSCTAWISCLIFGPGHVPSVCCLVSLSASKSWTPAIFGIIHFNQTMPQGSLKVPKMEFFIKLIFDVWVFYKYAKLSFL